MPSLREKLLESSRFLVAAELVSARGSMAEKSAIKARGYANELVANPDIDWISITDNAGGNPQLAPLALWAGRFSMPAKKSSFTSPAKISTAMASRAKHGC